MEDKKYQNSYPFFDLIQKFSRPFYVTGALASLCFVLHRATDILKICEMRTRLNNTQTHVQEKEIQNSIDHTINGMVSDGIILGLNAAVIASIYTIYKSKKED